MAHIGYARVSTTDQGTALQFDALACAGSSWTFEDRASGAQANRTGLREAPAYVRVSNVLVTWKLDRLGRSLRHLIVIVAALEKRRVGFCSITEAIDTTTPGGRLLFHLLGVRARPNSRAHPRGPDRRRSKGTQGRRKPVITDNKLKRARNVGQGLDRSRDRSAAESGEDRALRSPQTEPARSPAPC